MNDEVLNGAETAAAFFTEVMRTMTRHDTPVVDVAMKVENKTIHFRIEVTGAVPNDPA